MKVTIAQSAKRIFLIVALLLVAVLGCLALSLALNLVPSVAYAAPDWLEDFKVGLSFDEETLVTEKTTGAGDFTVQVKIFYSVPEGMYFNRVDVKIRTRNFTAVAGEDYTAFDSTVSLLGLSSKKVGNKVIYYDTVTIAINKNRERLVIGSNSQQDKAFWPYFYVELYDVLTENFSAQENAKSLKVNVRSSDVKSYIYNNLDNQLFYGQNHTFFHGFVGSTLNSYSNLDIYSVDKSGQTLAASQSFINSTMAAYGGYSDLQRDYINTGLGNLYIGGQCELDENGVTMTSWCTLKLYDGSTAGTQLYTGEFRHIDEDTLVFGKSYGDMYHENESFASDEYHFKTDGKLGWPEYHFMKLSSGTIYETFKSDSNYWRKTYDWKLQGIVVDETAPYIKSWHIDQSRIQEGEKIRISVRFNEPINAMEGDIGSIKLNTTLVGSGGFNGYNATFDCVSPAVDYGKYVYYSNQHIKGLVTDTLVFEFDPSSAKDTSGNPLIGTINSIDVKGFTNLNKIYDYGRNRSDSNNYCKNYNTLSSLEADKCSPRQTRSSMTLSFDNRPPQIDMADDIPSDYVNDFSTTVTTSGTSNLFRTFCLVSTSPDLDYIRVASPKQEDIANYFELAGDAFVKTTDTDIVEGKTYYFYRRMDLARTYLYDSGSNIYIGQGTMSDENWALHQDTMRYKENAAYPIWSSTKDPIDINLKGLSGQYYVHVFAKTNYSKTGTASAYDTRFTYGPIKVDNSAPKFEDIQVSGEAQQKTVSVRIDELAGINKVEVSFREVRFDADDPESETKTLTVLERNNDGTFADPNGFGATFDNGILTFTVKAKEHVGLTEDEGGKNFGDFYIGFSGVDIVGNQSTSIYSTEDKSSFDMRVLFRPYVKVDGEYVTFNDPADTENYLLPYKNSDKIAFYAGDAYVVDISGGSKTIVIGHPGASDTVDGYAFMSIQKMENNVRALLSFDGSKIVLSADNSTTYFENVVVDQNGGNDAFVTFDATTPGYYEFTTRAKFGGEETYSYTQRFYVTNGNGESVGQNYDAVFNVGVNIKNKVFALSTARFYARTGTGMGSSSSSYYNNSEQPVVFSDNLKALDYVIAMEYFDLYPVRVTSDILKLFNNGTLTIERGVNRRPAVGDVWIRYKASTWNFSTAQRDWTYYYYGGTSVTPDTINVNELSASLTQAIDNVAAKIIAKGSDMYVNSATGMDQDTGALFVDPIRIPRSFTVEHPLSALTTTFVNTGDLDSPFVYTFDKDIYYDLYNGKEDAKLISSYRFTYTNATKVFFAPAEMVDDKPNLDMNAYRDVFALLSTPYLSQSVTESGFYVVRELDEKGLRDFAVYVDKDAPTVSIEYKDLEGQNGSAWWTKSNDGDVLHTTDFTIRNLEDKAPNDNYQLYSGGADADLYSYVAIFDVTYGEKTFVRGFALNEHTSYEIPYGVYVVEVCDRAGNRFSVTVSRAKTVLDTVITVTENDNVRYVIPDRLPTEIERIIVNRPGRAGEEINFVETATQFDDGTYGLVYTDAGRYEFSVTDKYGYTMSPASDPDTGMMHSIAELSRKVPSEIVKWYSISSDKRYVELPPGDVSLFRSDTYYIANDDKLAFSVDSTTIFSFAFTGNVTYTTEEKAMEDGKTYLYVTVNSTERWSVKIYYTLYPDLSATYNRIAKKAVVPAAIDLRPLERSSTGVAQADESGRIVVYVGTQNEVVDPITVTVKTRDRSAIASLGDYDTYEGTVTLTSDNREQIVVIQTHPLGLSTYNTTTYEYANRTFDLFIDEIVGNAEKGKATLECACPGKQELNIATKDGIQVFEAYLTGTKTGLQNAVFEKLFSTRSTGRTQEANSDFSLDSTWMSMYINTGLARAYVGEKLSLSADDSSNYPDLRLTLSDKTTGSQLFQVYVKEIDENMSVHFGYSYDGELKVSNESYDKNTSIVMSENRGDAISGRYFLVPKDSKGSLRFNAFEQEGSYVVYNSQGGASTYYIVPARNINDPTAYAILIDSTAPTVESWHIDHNTIRVGDKLRLSIRFSEPVYVSGKNPVVTANVVGALTGIDFNYAGGAGTDTLYFEFDPSASNVEVNAEALTIASVSNFDSICDYAYNVSKLNNKVGTNSVTLPRNSEWDSKCSLDTRTPKMDIDSTYTIPAAPIKSTTVPIAVSKTTKGAVMEYAWTVEPEAPAIYSNREVLTNTSQVVRLQANGMSGAYYLHVYMKSVYGKVTTQSFGPFLFDNTAPSITGLMVEEATKALKERNVTFYVNDEPRGGASSGVVQIYAYYLFRGESASKTLLLYEAGRDEKLNKFNIPENNRVSFLLKYADLGISKEDQKDVTLAFYAVDTLGNVASITNYTYCPTNVNFDARSEVGVTMSSKNRDTGDEFNEFFNADGTPVYNMVGTLPEFNFAFSRQADEYDIRELYIGDKKIVVYTDEGKKIDNSGIEQYIDEANSSSDVDGVHIVFKQGVVGYIRINFIAISGMEANRSIQTSEDVAFYLTQGADIAETVNYKATQSGTLFINKVYQLDTAVFYYHANGRVSQLNYSNVGTEKSGIADFMSFSSRDKAIEYVRFYEMQDLSVMYVASAGIATSLNSGDGSYLKADADKPIQASVGQYWVRYKRSTWNNSTQPGDWVYYFLGTSSEIDPERLPSSLSDAIGQVTTTIVDRGGYRYLTSYDDGLDENGSPKLRKERVAVSALRSFLTLSGNEMRSAVAFSGDPDIYNSEILTPSGEVCSLVTTYRFEYGSFTKIFYTNQVDASGKAIAKEYKLLPEGTVFGSLNIDSGVYWIRECDAYGVRDFKVYLDKTAPTINVVYENAKGESILGELDASLDGSSRNGKSFVIKGFSESIAEIDDMSYIAVFKKNGTLVNVYRKEDIPTYGIEVSEGQYYIEVADRSGNIFRINAYMNSTPMTVKVLVEENRNIRIQCNRDASEIKTYEVYLDGKLIESNYVNNVIYYQAGVYSIRVEDWFGNTFSYDYELKREQPQLEWFWYDSNEGGQDVPYDGSQSNLKISKMGEREYQIVTNKTLMFTFATNADYEFQFAEANVTYRKTDFSDRTRVRINEAIDWTLTVRYAKFPDVYVIYHCMVDLTAPIINVTARQDIVKYVDQQQVDTANKGIVDQSLITEDEQGNQYLTPNSEFFYVSKTISKAVRNNSTVYSPIITLQFSDDSICSEVDVFVDDVLIRSFSESAGVSNVTVNRFGSYRIVARDTLGNESEFTFVNKESDSAKLFVDERELKLKLSPADSISEEDGVYSYAPDAYAYDHMEVRYDGSATIVFMVEKNGKKQYLRYEVVDGALYSVIYQLSQTDDTVYDESGNLIKQYHQVYSSMIIQDLNKAERNKTYQITGEDTGVDILVRIDEEGHVYYRVDAPKEGEASVTMRLTYNEEYQPYFVKAVLCGELPEITFEITGDEVKRVTPTTTDNIVYLNGEFFIVDTSFLNVTSVEIAHSDTTEFVDYQLVYTPNEGYTKLLMTEEGFYSVIAKNIYGRVAEFVVIMSSELRVVVTTEYTDGTFNTYSASTKRSFKANESVSIDIYFEDVSVVLTHNGVKGEQTRLHDSSGVCSMAWKEEGTYEIVITDGFGNVVELSFEIASRSFEFKHDYLTGYNEKALKLSEGYTNKKLSVDATKMIEDGILQAIVQYGDQEIVAYDVLKSKGTGLVPELLTDVVGSLGDGVYVLKMRNEYGNVTQALLHYRGTDTLSVSRTIRTSRDPEPIGITAGEINKVYSNFNVTFETIAQSYEIRIDGARADMPLVVTYPSDGEEAGEYVSVVIYVDEYGFEYEFEVNLVRKTLAIDLNSFMKIVTIKDVVMTQDNVKIEFDSSVKCEVSLSGGERAPYQSGEVLTADGTYRFYITDIAGNIFTTTVKKDTLVEFAFINGYNDRTVENGGVITQGSARFVTVNKDSSKIDLIVLNGMEFDPSQAVGFGETGKWEFIISDDIGNKTYFYFYVVTHEVSRFEYVSPYTFKITNVQYDAGDGVLISYLNSVTQYANNSKMIFEDKGLYLVTVSSMVTAAQFTFEITVDKTLPTAQLKGVENGGSTIENVTLTDCRVGDVIRLYKNGDLAQTVVVTSESMKLPEIKDKGDYKIVVTNSAGNEKVFEFTRQYTANVATTITIIAACLLMSIGLFVVLLLRKRRKV